MYYDKTRWTADTEGMRAKRNAKTLADVLVRYSVTASLPDDKRQSYIKYMMEITGESREEVLKQVEDMRAAALAAGENPDDYAVPVERKILYFPDGFTS